MEEALLRASNTRCALRVGEAHEHRAARRRGERGQHRAAESAERAATVVKRVDERIAEHVSVLARAYAAASTAHAAEASLDDAAMRSVESVGESLESMSKAIVDEV